ncbi:MAG TPA: glutathione S-transferase family protein [Gaiellaceae bacterium]|nr:glutathione S-transferase family protein [Gaiellaceae bacterium]
MPGLTLYDNPTSSNALKVRFLLAELGLDYERVEVPLARPRPDWYLALNPVGGIPTLVDGELVLPESNTILRYLAAREGRNDLYPDDLAARARVDRLLDTWSTFVRPALFPLERACGLFGEHDEAAASRALEQLDPVLDAVERLVADNGTMTGAFTIADVCVAPTLFRSAKLELPIDWTRRPRLAAVREAVTGRASFAAAGPVR